MELERAKGVAAEVVARLGPACERVEVAGSVRRRKAEVKDLEVVFIPRMERAGAGGFEVAEG